MAALILVLLGLASVSVGCSPLYLINGDGGTSTTLGHFVGDVAPKIMHGLRIDLEIPPTSIRDSELTIPSENGSIINAHFVFNPARALKSAVSNLDSMSYCDQQQLAECRVIGVQVLEAYASPGIGGDTGFYRPMIYIELRARLTVEGTIREKSCLVPGYGTSRWGMWASGRNLSPGFQLAVRSAFAGVLVCLVTPDSLGNYDRPGAAAAFAAHAVKL